MKTISAMLCSIILTIMIMMTTATLINYMEGDILPDTSPWSFISYTEGIIKEMLK